jgi:hypothetical protein
VANSDRSASGSIAGITDTSVVVTCDAGYSGSGSAICGTNGVFSTVTCSVNSCEATEVANSNKKASGAITGTTGVSVTVTCDAGFLGGGDMTCGIDGTFSTVTCTPASCLTTHVANSDYAEIAISGHTFETVTVTCDEGYSGSADAVCGIAGTFSTVVCSATSCASTQVPHSNFKSSGSIVGTTGERRGVICDAGYFGSGEAVCGTDGTFSTVTCTPNPCQSTQVANSDHTATDSVSGSTGDTVKVQCLDGYSGSANAVCGSNGVFSAVVCIGYPCGATSVADSDHSGIGSISGTTGDVVTVTCNQGYSGSGDATCRHSNNNFFFEDVPVCVANPCTPSQVANSNQALAGSITGVTDDIHQIVCDPGYHGGGSVWCQADGSFSPMECHVSGCEASEVQYSDHWDVGSLNGFTHDQVLVTCMPGYSGTGYATCLTDGSWSAVFCAPEPCVSTQVENSDMAITNSISGVTGSEITVTCDAGYSGGGVATCDATGNFNSLTCSANSCLPYSVSGSDHSNRDAIFGVTGDMVSVNCLGGLVGSNVTTCGTDGIWNPHVFCEIGNPASSGSSTPAGGADETVLYFSSAPALSAQVALTILSLVFLN